MIQGATVAHAKDVWKAACPLKVRILIWQMARARLPYNAQIKHRHVNSDGNCVLCHRLEDADHIFFTCPLAQFAWSCCRELLKVDWNPNSFADLFAIFQRFKGVSKRFLWMFFAAQSWALWTTRNKFSIEAKFPKHPANVVFKTCIFLQLWKPLAKAKVHPMLDEAVAKLKDISKQTLQWCHLVGVAQCVDSLLYLCLS
jgi:hypothetical protein